MTNEQTETPVADAPNQEVDVNKLLLALASSIGQLSEMVDKLAEKVGTALFRLSVVENEVEQFKPRKVG